MSDAAVGSFLPCCTIFASLPRGLPTCLARSAFFLALPVYDAERFLHPWWPGSWEDMGTERCMGKTMSLLPSLRWTSLHGFSRAIDRLLGDA